MARYTGPKTKIARKFGEPVYGPDKYFEKKNYPPGQHGLAKKRKKISEYGNQLKENTPRPAGCRDVQVRTSSCSSSPVWTISYIAWA